MIEAKSLFGSKVFWIAMAQAVIAVVIVFQGYYPDAGWLLMAKSMLDIALRMMTTKPIEGVLPQV